MCRSTIALSLCGLLASVAGCSGGGADRDSDEPQSNLFSGGATVAIGGSSTLSDVALADLNEDGSLDLLVVSESTGNLFIALGEQLGGDAHFGQPPDEPLRIANRVLVDCPGERWIASGCAAHRRSLHRHRGLPL